MASDWQMNHSRKQRLFSAYKPSSYHEVPAPQEEQPCAFLSSCPHLGVGAGEEMTRELLDSCVLILCWVYNYGCHKPVVLVTTISNHTNAGCSLPCPRAWCLFLATGIDFPLEDFCGHKALGFMLRNCIPGD